MDADTTKRSSSPGPSSEQPSRKRRRRCLSEAAREKKRRKRLARISIPVDPSRAQSSHSGHPAWLPTPRQFWVAPPPEGNVVALDCEKLMVRTLPGSKAKEKPVLASVAIVDVLGRVVFEAICAPPRDARPVGGQHCPISEHQFRVAAAEQVSVESVQEQVGTLLMGRTVVGFAIDDDLQVLGISRNDLTVRDIQLHFDAVRCSEPDLSVSELPPLDDSCRVHSLRNLAKCVLHKSIPEGPHSVALVDARATMELYLKERGRIEEKTW